MKWLVKFISVAFALVASAAFAGPAEDANAAVDRWAQAYSANDVDALAKLYTSNAILLGTTSPIISESTAGIRVYFKDIPGSGRKNLIAERRTIVVSDEVVICTGFYNFFRPEQKDVPRPSRYTFVLVKRGGEWLISHHHSSPLSAERK